MGRGVVVGPPGYRPNGLGFTDVGKGMLALAPVDVQQPLQAAMSTRTGGFGARVEFARRGDAVQFQNVGRDRQVGLYGRDRVVAIGVSRMNRDPWVAFGRIGQRLRTRLPLAVPGWSGDTIALASNERGDVAVTAIVCTVPTCANRRLYLFQRPFGGDFGRPVRVADRPMDEGEFGGGPAPDVAINADGDVLVAWGQWGPRRERVLRVRARSDGRWRGPAQSLGALEDSTRVEVSLSDQRRAVVAWWTQDSAPGGYGPLAPPRFSAALAGSRGRFGPPFQFDVGALGPPPISGARRASFQADRTCSRQSRPLDACASPGPALTQPASSHALPPSAREPLWRRRRSAAAASWGSESMTAIERSRCGVKGSTCSRLSRSPGNRSPRLPSQSIRDPGCVDLG